LISKGGDKTNFESSIRAVERETLNDRVYRELRTMIMSGGFVPGAEMKLRTLAQVAGHEQAAAVLGA
jgi:DNA-binding GntR family transcriptional regulator